MNDVAQPGPGQPGPWGARSTAAAMAAAEQAARASVPAVGTSAPATLDAAPVRIGFSGQGGAFFGLLLKGMLLQILTLGIYRFWFITDQRRFFWSHTNIGPESITYTGRGIELLKGFLIALAILVPIYALIFFLTLGLPEAETVISMGGSVVFLFLGQYAVYAARRYRLTRTSFRGLRLRMVGSAWTYAAKAFGLWILVILSLGLAYPWAAAVMERIRMRDTWFGDAQGDFVGSGGTLMRRGILLWALGFGLPLFIVVTTILSTPGEYWQALGTAVANGNFDIRGAAALALVGLGLSLSSAIFIPILLFPAFQAIVFRWRMEGMRLGGAALASDFRIGTSYRVYGLGILALFGLSVLVLVVGGLVAGGLVFSLFADAPSLAQSPLAGIAGIAFIAIAYLVVFGGFWIAKQLLITLRLYRAQARSLSVLNLAALDHVHANNVDASAMGDSLGDAVDILGF